jgi:hypothetical protein
MPLIKHDPAALDNIICPARDAMFGEVLNTVY